MNPESTLPQLHQAELDEKTLRQLFTDIGDHAELMEIVIKQHASGHVDENPARCSCGEALDFLLDNSVRGIQLRYRHDGAVWWDTLTPTPQGTFRIVRIRHEFRNS